MRPLRDWLFLSGIRPTLVALVLSTLVPLLILDVVLMYQYRARHQREALQSLHDLAEATNAAFQHYIEGIWSLEMGLEQALFRQDRLLPPEEVTPLLRQHLEARPSIKVLAVISAGGQVIAATEGDMVGIRVDDRAYFQQLVEGSQVSISDMIITRTTGEHAVVVARAINRSGGFVGAVIAGISLDGLEAVLPRSDTSTVGLVDTAGQLVYARPDRATRPRQTAPDHPARTALNGESVAVPEYYVASGQPARMGAFVPVQPYGWAAYASSWRKDVFAGIHRDILYAALLHLVVGLGALALASRTAGALLKSARGLKLVAGAIAQGDLTVRAIPVGHDELAQTQVALNHMADQIHEAQQQLRVRSRQQKAVSELGLYALRGAGLGDLMHVAAGLVADELNMDTCSILEVVPGAGELVVRGAVGWRSDVKGMRIPADASLAGCALLAEGTAVMEDAAAERRFTLPSKVVEEGVVAGMAVVIPGWPGPYGTISVFTRQRHTFTPADEHFVQAVALVLSCAARRDQYSRYTGTTHAVTRILAESRSLGEAAPSLLEATCTGLEWETGSYWVVDRASGSLRCRHVWEQEKGVSSAVPDSALAEGEGMAGAAWRDGQPCWGREPGSREGTVAAYPVFCGDVVHGVLLWASRVARDLDQEVASLMADVTSQVSQAVERQHAEDELRSSAVNRRALIQASPLAIVMLDQAGLVREWNPAAEALFGWEASEVLGRPLPNVPADQVADLHRIRASVMAGEVVVRTTFRRQHKSGSPIDISAAIAPVRGPDGQIAGSIALMADVSERRRFLQIAAHELRNPMGGIKGVLSLVKRRLTEGRPTGDLHRLTGVMEREVERLSGLLDAIFEAVHLEAGQLRLELSVVDLRQVVQTAIAPMLELHPQRQIALNVAGDNPLLVSGDSDRLEEVIRNLLSNAVKYSPSGSPIDVSLVVAGNDARIAVQDQGMGIASDELACVFEQFYRSVRLSGRDPGGMGLGLFICREIISRHGGRIWAESEPGNGSTFYIELPLEESHGTHSGH